MPVCAAMLQWIRYYYSLK